MSYHEADVEHLCSLWKDRTDGVEEYLFIEKFIKKYKLVKDWPMKFSCYSIDACAEWLNTKELALFQANNNLQDKTLDELVSLYRLTHDK